MSFAASLPICQFFTGSSDESRAEDGAWASGNLSPDGHAYLEYRSTNKSLERKVTRIYENGVLFGAAHAATGASEYMYVSFFPWAVKHPGDEVPVRRDGFTAYRAASAQIVFHVGVTVGTSKYVHDAVGFSGKHSGFYLFPRGKPRRAQRAATDGRSCFLLLLFPAGRCNREYSVRKHQKNDSNKNEYHYVIRT